MFEVEKITGGKLFFLGDGTKIMNIPSAELTYEPNVRYERDDCLVRNFKGEITLEINNSDFNLEAITGLNKDKFPEMWDLEYTEYVQARKHKKKRINKKWLKRYGVIGIPVKSKGWEVTNYADGSFEFTKR